MTHSLHRSSSLHSTSAQKLARELGVTGPASPLVEGQFDVDTMASSPQKGTIALAGTVPDIPEWLSTKSLTRRRYLPASTGNLHGLQAGEFHSTKWPLPKMFGEERYAYSLIDIEDPR